MKIRNVEFTEEQSKLLGWMIDNTFKYLNDAFTNMGEIDFLSSDEKLVLIKIKEDTDFQQRYKNALQNDFGLFDALKDKKVQID